MRDHQSPVDIILGYGGLVLAVIAMLSLSGSPEVGDNAEVVPSVVGIVMVVWLVAATIRHLRVYPRGDGRAWLVTAWVVLGLLLAISVFQAVDTAAFDDGLVDGLLRLATSPPRLLLIVPLVLASIAILSDGRHRMAGHGGGLPASGH